MANYPVSWQWIFKFPYLTFCYEYHYGLWLLTQPPKYISPNAINEPKLIPTKISGIWYCCVLAVTAEDVATACHEEQPAMQG